MAERRGAAAHFAAVQELLGGKTTVAKALATLDETYRKK